MKYRQHMVEILILNFTRPMHDREFARFTDFQHTESIYQDKL